MKKKTVTKLSLTRDTLRSLGENQLDEAAGAETRGPACSGPSFCPSICAPCVTTVCV